MTKMPELVAFMHARDRPGGGVHCGGCCGRALGLWHCRQKALAIPPATALELCLGAFMGR
jgi:hypothetical protein